MSADMRRVKFTLSDRLVLVPVEFVQILLPLIIVCGILFFTVGLIPSLAVASAIIAGTVLFPALLPWLPTRNFSTKGFILGGIVAATFGLAHILNNLFQPWYFILISTTAFLLALPPITSFLALNFTGASTFTSRSGVRKEINIYFPVMVWSGAAGIVLFLVSIILSLTGGR